MASSSSGLVENTRPKCDRVEDGAVRRASEGGTPSLSMNPFINPALADDDSEMEFGENAPAGPSNIGQFLSGIRKHHETNEDPAENDADSGTWTEVTSRSKKKRTDTTNANSFKIISVNTGQHQGNQQSASSGTIPEVSECNEIIIKFVGISVDEDFLNDNGTLFYLLRNSPFTGKFQGKGNKVFSKHELTLKIIDSRYISDLLNIKYLEDGDQKWPIVCSTPARRQEENHCFGIIKVHPSIKDDRLKAEINRNFDLNTSTGAKVMEIFRIKRREGPSQHVSTWSVRLKFEGKNKPEYFYHGEEYLDVITYYPRLVICSKCAKSGHIAKYCNNTPRCGRCSKHHEKWKCTVDKDNQAGRRCPNCQQNHTAGYGGCQYIKIEKKVLRTHAEEQTSKRALRTALWADVVANRRGEQTPARSQTGNTGAHQHTE